MKKQQSPLITYIRLGQRCVRRRPTHVSNPRTPKQQANRLRFAQRYAQRNQGVRPLDSTETNPSEPPLDSSDPTPSNLRINSDAIGRRNPTL